MQTKQNHSLKSHVKFGLQSTLHATRGSKALPANYSWLISRILDDMLCPFSKQRLFWFLNKDGRGLLFHEMLTQADAKSPFHSLSLILQWYSRGDRTDSQGNFKRNNAPFWPWNPITDMVCAEAYMELTFFFFLFLLQVIHSRKKWWNSEPPHLTAPDSWNHKTIS